MRGTAAPTRLPDANDPGLLTPAQTSLLTDQYELAMASSYLGRGMNEAAVFELFVRHLPPRRRWLVAAGLGPALALVREMKFAEEELGYVRSLGFPRPFLEYLARFRFTGDVDAMPEGTVAFANFQTMVATKAARIALAPRCGTPADERLIDFSPRRDHGTDAAMKAARRCGDRRRGRHLEPSCGDALRAPAGRHDGPFVRDVVRAGGGCVPRVDGGLPRQRSDALSYKTRALLDEAGMTEARIVASGDLEENQIAELTAVRAPIDSFGAGTERDVRKRSPEKATTPGIEQVFRSYEDGEMRGDVIVRSEERLPGQPLLVPFGRSGGLAREETFEQMRDRTCAQLRALPPGLCELGGEGNAYPVTYSDRCRSADESQRSRAG